MRLPYDEPVDPPDPCRCDEDDPHDDGWFNHPARYAAMMSAAHREHRKRASRGGENDPLDESG